MVPLLTKLACRSFAVLVLVAGVAVGVHIGLSEDGEVRDPRQLAEDDLRADEAEQESSRDWHRSYTETAAGSDAAGKAESIAEVASDQAKALDDTYEGLKAEEEEEDEPKSGVDVGPIPEDCNEFSGNKEIGCALLLENGFELDQMPCLEPLWDKESGWNEQASNGGSGAYGIPQALPGDKMASHGSDWETNPATQIAWGLDYISGRYGDPCSAWEHSEANGWY
ncbi:MAG: lytic transglycosylase domain-containing protein [Stackebrandtia sp.]